MLLTTFAIIATLVAPAQIEAPEVNDQTAYIIYNAEDISGGDWEDSTI